LVSIFHFYFVRGRKRVGREERAREQMNREKHGKGREEDAAK
jgi:hypothetical protein